MYRAHNILTILIFTLLLGQCWSATIVDYAVPASVPLGQKITATGTYTSDINEGIKCSFYFLDDLNNLVYRATDQYTTATGRFTMTGKTLLEPDFKRAHTYTLQSECGDATAQSTFTVAQREDIATLGANEFTFLMLPGNIGTIGAWLIFGGALIGIILLITWVWRQAR
jgi:hypothetical protein